MIYLLPSPDVAAWTLLSHSRKKTNKTINKNNLDINLNSQLTVQQHVNRVTSDVLSRFDGLLVHIQQPLSSRNVDS